MKVLQIHVGNEVQPDSSKPEGSYLQRISFTDGQLKYYGKWDIVNADTQMQALMEQGVDIVYGHLSARKSIKALVQSGLRLRKLCKEENVDIVHVYWGSTTALMVALFSPKPFIISFAGSDLLGNVNADGSKTRGGKISRFFSVYAAGKATRVITMSQHMRSTLPAEVQHKTVVIPDGVFLDRFTPMDKSACRERIGWDQSKKYIMFFDGGGALVKDALLANKVYEAVKQQHPNTVFFIARDIVHEDLVYYYNAADVMILTSYHEGSNNSIKEARACNTPVVSVNVGDAKERLANVENSYVVNSRDPHEIADKVLTVFKTGKRSNGSRLSSEVSHETSAKKVVAVYKEVANKDIC